MYDVILVNSKSCNNFEYLKIRGVGAHLIAQQARDLGLTALVIDFVESWSIADFETACRKFVGHNTRVFGFSTTWLDVINNPYPEDHIGNYLVNGNYQTMIDIVKSINSDINIVAGGKKSLELYHKLHHSIDHFFDGYSETQFRDYVKQNKIFSKVIDYDTEALPRDDYDFKYASNIYTPESFITPRETLALELSRGCRFKCKFCSFPLIGRKDSSSYIKDADTLRAELIYNYENFGVQKYTIQDDTFNDSLEKVEYFANMIATLPFKVYFWCYLRAEVIVNHPEMIPMLYEMGLTETWFGIETFTQKAGKNIGKGMDPDRIKSMLWDCKAIWKNRVKVQSGYIVGLPGETEEDIIGHAEWFKQAECPVDEVMYNPLGIRPKAIINFLRTREISDFDRNYDQYGYYFPLESEFTGSESDLKRLNHFYVWYRHTQDEIPSMIEAMGISKILNDNQQPYTQINNSKLHTNIFQSSRDDYAIGLSNDKIREIKAKDINLQPNNVNTFNTMIKSNYINKLLDL